MSSRSKNSLACLALAGVLIPCAAPFPLRAGDKIEFSIPAATLQVPRAQTPEKVAVRSTFDAPLAPDAALMEEAFQPPSDVVIVSPQKKKNDKSRDSDFSDSRDAARDSDNPYGTLERKAQPADLSTNLWDADKTWNQAARSVFADPRTDADLAADALHSRLQNLHPGERIEFERDEHYGRRPLDSDENADATGGFFHHGLFGPDTADQKSGPTYEEMRAMDDASSQSYTLTRPYDPAGDLLRQSQMAPGLSEYNSQVDTLRGKTPDESQLLAPRPYRPVEPRAVSVAPDPYARQEPPASPPGDVQSRPAVLPFPKRPGSVFQ